MTSSANIMNATRRTNACALFATLVLMFCCSSCSAQTGDIVVKDTTEYDRDKDGTPDLLRDIHRRGDMRVFVNTRRKLSSGVWSVTRMYLVSNEIVSVEDDRDGDGVFESMIAFNSSKSDLEVFLRREDGSTFVAPTSVKASFQKMVRAIDELWSNADGVEDWEAAEGLIERAQESVRAAIGESEEMGDP